MGLPSIGSGSRAAWYSISEAEVKGKVESSVRQSVNQSPVVHRVDSGLIDMQIRCVLHSTSQQRGRTDGQGIHSTHAAPAAFLSREALSRTNRPEIQGEEGEIFQDFYLSSPPPPPGHIMDHLLSRPAAAPEYLWNYKRRLRRYLECVSNAPLAPPKPKGWACISDVRPEVAGNDPNCQFRENNGFA